VTGKETGGSIIINGFTIFISWAGWDMASIINLKTVTGHCIRMSSNTLPGSQKRKVANMAYKSIRELRKGEGGSRYALDSIYYKTAEYNTVKRCMIIIPVPISKKAGIEPGTLVDIEYDDEQNLCRISLAKEKICPRVHYHGKHKNHVKITFKLYDNWLPRKDTGIYIKEYNVSKGIGFKIL
jgi:bifunctional DNA-binding transcriptional regulator/antitoxin component of YhaV-PrlF toxin-antitoxin module